MNKLVMFVGFICGFCVSTYEHQGVKQEILESDFSSEEADMSKFMKKIIPRISFRLVRKNWILKNHPYEDEVYDEYPGTWQEAFKIMYREYYPYAERKIENSEELFTLKNENGEVEYDTNLPSIVIFHPLNGKADVPFVRAAMTAMRLRNLHKRYNLFAIDMPQMNPSLYLQIFKELTGFNARYEEISEVLLMPIMKGISNGHIKPKDLHLVGFSVSGNLVGYMGRHILLVYKEKIGSIISLDPYSNDRNKYFIHLSSDDASVVHIYHSCSYMAGTRERIATADFVFNGGFMLPECRNLLRQPNPFGCSHKKIALRFWYIILFPSQFKARKCATRQRFKNCYCEDNDEATLTYPIENNPAAGIYHIITAGSKPYGLGESGSRCNEKKKERFLKKCAVFLQRASSLLT